MRIALAGVESSHEHLWAACLSRARSVLTSFFYADTIEHSNRFNLWKSTLHQATFRLVDSGAYTFRTTALWGNKETAAGIDVDAYLDRYIKWILRMRSLKLVDYWVEMDIGVAVGAEWVTQHRKRFFDAGLGYGLIRVWHSLESDWQGWLDLIAEAKQPNRSRFVAIEGRSKYYAPIDYTKFIRAAYDQGVRVHGFRMTSFKDLKRYPFYSVDSTTWTTAVRFGVTHSVRNGWLESSLNGDRVWRGRLIPRRTSTYRTRLDLVKTTAAQWVKAEKQITELWEKRGINWDKQLEKVLHEEGKATTATV
jgi:hypothetical protein